MYEWKITFVLMYFHKYYKYILPFIYLFKWTRTYILYFINVHNIYKFVLLLTCWFSFLRNDQVISNATKNFNTSTHTSTRSWYMASNHAFIYIYISIRVCVLLLVNASIFILLYIFWSCFTKIGGLRFVWQTRNEHR